MTSNGSAVPVGLLGEQRKTIDGWCRRACSAADSAVRSNVPGLAGAAQPVDPRRAERLADDRVHRVARREAERGAARPAEGLHDVREHLVGAVARPDLVGGHRHPRLLLEVCRERLAQLGEVAVGVAVETRHVVGERSEDGLDDGLRAPGSCSRWC